MVLGDHIIHTEDHHLVPLLIYLFCHHKKHRLSDIVHYIRERVINIVLCLQSEDGSQAVHDVNTEF